MEIPNLPVRISKKDISLHELGVLKLRQGEAEAGVVQNRNMCPVY